DGGSLIEAAVDDLHLYESLGNGTNIEQNVSDGKMPKIIRVTDYLGREVNPKSKSLNISNLIYYFDDGSVKKKSIYSKL
ncbi:hypothetical protein OAR04_02230, partial [Flavobacteriales bacterium]|nr:hypothetical protein [Flavobacteriales bacterium]